jgi:diacylglycerol kinase (ATP)
MPKSDKRGLARIAAAAVYSMAGLRAALRHEEAFRQEAAAALLLVPAAFWLGRGALERCLLIGSWLLVLIVELLNSAIEAVVDRISHDHHELSAQAKDMGSAAVFLTLVLAGSTWTLIAWDRYATGW